MKPTDPDEKMRQEQHKIFIQNSLREKIGILVDMVQQGTGSTDDGNTARGFFDNTKIVHEVTG